MANKLFVGGFPYETTPDAMSRLFADCGTVTDVRLIMDRETGRPKGFGFVTMSSDAEALAAAAKLNGADLGGRKLFVTVAREPAKPAGPAEWKPGFVERRSGKDRRRAAVPAAPAGERREGPPAEKKWDKKPWEKKPWEKKPWDKKPDAKPWEKKKPWDKKPGDFGGKKPERKPWDKKPGAKPWEKKPWDKKPDAKPWEKKKPWADKPAGVEGGRKWEKKPVPLRPRNPGGARKGG